MTLVTVNISSPDYHQRMATQVGTLHNSRLKTMVIPREHGAWGMLLVPLATGAVVALPFGVNGGALTLFALAAMSLFWLRTPIEAWFGTSAIRAQTRHERSLVLRALVCIGVLAAGSVASLLCSGQHGGLLLIGAVAGMAFTVQAGIKKLGPKARMSAQIVGAVGLTSTAAGAYYVATGKLDHVALALWLAHWLFAGNQIHFVQLRIRCNRTIGARRKLRQGSSFLAGQLGLVCAIFALWYARLFPAPVALAFAPALFRGTLWFARGRQPLDVHKLGFTELGHSLIFGALLCMAFLA